MDIGVERPHQPAIRIHQFRYPRSHSAKHPLEPHLDLAGATAIILLHYAPFHHGAVFCLTAELNADKE